MPAGRRRGPRASSSRPWRGSATRCSATSEVGRADRAGRATSSTARRAARRVDRRRPDPGRRPRLGEGPPGARPSCAPRWRAPSRIAEHAWVEARRDSDFAAAPPPPRAQRRAGPPLRRLLRGVPGLRAPLRPAARRVRAGDDHRARCARCSAELREGLVPLVARGDRRPARPADDPLPRRVRRPTAQRALVAELIAELPLPEDSWRLDPTDAPLRDLDRAATTSG